MEIHAPTKPVESIREFLIHLSMVTIGILIALGLEQAVEAWHHHEPGVEARENISNEIRDNKQAVDRARPIPAKNKEALQQSFEVVRLYLAHKPPEQTTSFANWSTRYRIVSAA